VVVEKRNFRIAVLKPDCTGELGTLPTYSSASVTWQRLGLSTAQITVPADSPQAAPLLLAHNTHAPVTMISPGYPRFGGRVTRAELDKETGRTPVLSFYVAGQRSWIERMIAAPTPGQPWSNQSTEHDVRTGPIATVARAFVSANLARINAVSALPIPMSVVPAPSGDPSPVVTVEARNETIGEEVGDALRASGYDFEVSLWLPGDPQPPGLSLSAPRIVVDVVGGRDQRYVNFTDTTGGLANYSVVSVAPQGTHVVVGGPGEGTARLFQYVPADDGRIAALGPFGYHEVFLDATDADSADTRERRARDKLAELSGKVSVEVTIDDRRPWVAGPGQDYWINDLVRATFSGIVAEDRIDRITVTDNAEGFTVTPQFGATRQTESSDIQLIRLVSELSRKITQMQARR
jgi:hypothetical protein